MHPVVATLGVAIVGLGSSWPRWRSALGALVTNFVVGHGLGRDDLDIARWFADRRTPTWNDLSVVGSYFARDGHRVGRARDRAGRPRDPAELAAVRVVGRQPERGGRGVRDRHVRHQPQSSRGAAPRGPHRRRQLSVGSHRRVGRALRITRHRRVVAHPQPLVARHHDRPRVPGADHRRHLARLPRHAQPDRRDLRRPDRCRLCRRRVRRRARRVWRTRTSDDVRRSRERSRDVDADPGRRCDDFDRGGRACRARSSAGD